VEDLAGRQLGAYRIVESVGVGGMAAVYKAHQPSVDRYVALKVLPCHPATDPQFLARFRHEARIVAQLQHPRILSILDFGESDGYAFLAMPLLLGGTLADLIANGPLPVEVALRVATEVCDALDYAHAKGVIHRDIKPSNILIDERGNCLLADFGIARPGAGVTRLTVTGAIMGTPAYMSPEQVEGADVGAASDLYSFGVVLYEMLAGKVPFDAETPIALALKHLSAPIPSPRSLNPTLTPQIETVLRKALARSASERFGSGEALVRALRLAVDAQKGEAAIAAWHPEELPPTVVISSDDYPTILEGKPDRSVQTLEESTRVVINKRRWSLVVIAGILLSVAGAVSYLGISTLGVRSVVAPERTIGEPARRQPLLTSSVDDQAHVLASSEASAIEQKIRDIQSMTSNVMVVATVQTIAPWTDIKQYSLHLFDNNGHGIGQSGKDNGILVLLALQERQVRIATGLGLQPIVTDQIADQVVQEMMPLLR
jgi:serine/threonine protein kinase